MIALKNTNIIEALYFDEFDKHGELGQHPSSKRRIEYLITILKKVGVEVDLNALRNEEIEEGGKQRNDRFPIRIWRKLQIRFKLA